MKRKTPAETGVSRYDLLTRLLLAQSQEAVAWVLYYRSVSWNTVAGLAFAVRRLLREVINRLFLPTTKRHILLKEIIGHSF